MAQSSTEAEYRVVASTAAELTCIYPLLIEMHISSSTIPVIYCDNIRATYPCANLVFHSRMKHVAIDYHFVHGKVIKGLLYVSYISTQDQFAIIMTKSLSKQRFALLRSKICLSNESTILWRNIRSHDFLSQSNLD